MRSCVEHLMAEGVLASDPLKANPILSDLQSIDDVRPLIRELPSSSCWQIILFAAVLITLAAVALRLRYLYCVRYSRRRALRSLGRLSKAAVDSDADLLIFYKRLNLIMRRFIQRRQRVMKMRNSLSRRHRIAGLCRILDELRLALTNTELLASLDMRTDERGLFNELDELLRECDLVKFARFRPTPESARSALKRARNFVLEWSRDDRGEGSQ